MFQHVSRKWKMENGKWKMMIPWPDYHLCPFPFPRRSLLSNTGRVLTGATPVFDHHLKYDRLSARKNQIEVGGDTSE
jgi:hypothetical protein